MADYPYGHPGYFNGTHAGQCPGYTGGATDSYGMYSGAGGMAADPNSTSSLTAQHTSMLGQNAYGFDNKAPDFVWQRGYSWCRCFTTQFTCFTDTKVQILTQKAALRCGPTPASSV